ncbi:MAG: hypothetical protein LBI42_12475 [Chitinispirillales bacterium]|jgi:hypothetical protein|nr:hypothetical protein [Chitinispirillales bacterium]
MAEKLVGAGQQFNTVLAAVNSSSDGDTVTITDSGTYAERLDMISLTGITLRSTGNDPDAFPVVKLYLDSNTLNHINNWVFSSLIFEPNGDSRFTFNLQNISFNRCVFRKYDYLFGCDYTNNGVKKIESCLFYDISDYVFFARKNFHANALLVKNCTFHNCANIFKDDFWNVEAAKEPKVNNCVFTACPNIASQVEDSAPPYGRRSGLFQQFKYCTFSNDPQTANAKFGESCLVNKNESDIYSRSGSGTLPSHFKITDNPSVYKSGSGSLGYSPDLGGFTRTSPYDRGAWECDGQPSIVETKMILPYINYQGAF